MKLSVNHYSKIIGKNQILDDITLHLESGKIYGLQGKNGSGKTMLLRAISGLIFPTAGFVQVDNKRVGKDIDFPHEMGIMIESPGFIRNYTAMENLRALAAIRGKSDEQDIREILELLTLDPDSPKKFRQFSLGMKQKLGIAAALMEHPKLVLLDEPTNALDNESVEILKAILIQRKQDGALIIIASHDKEELSFLSDEIFYMENGRIVK